MTMTAKTVFLTMVSEAKAAALAFALKRNTQTHILAFLLGAAIAIIGLRTAVKAIDIPEATPTPVEIVTEQPTGTEYQTDYDAACVARVLYGIRGYELSDTAKAAVIEVIKNRVADTACEFRTVNSIQEVCEQPSQWQGYTTNGSYLKEDYDLALEVLYDTSGARTIPEGCFFLVVNHGEVIVRTEWDGGNEWSVR